MQATMVQEEQNAIRSHVTKLKEAATNLKTTKSPKNPGNTKKRA
jgi:hypothetical protein